MAVKTGRDWILTIPAEDTTLEEIQEKFSRYRWTGQKEQGGKTGYKHWQIAIINDSSIRFKTLKNKFSKAHIEPRRGTRQELYDYVIKEDTRLEGPFSGGDWTNAKALLRYNPGRRGDLELVRDMVMFGKPRMTYEELLQDDYVGPVVAQNLQYTRELLGFRAKRDGASRDDVKVFWVYGDPGVGKTTRVLSDNPELYRVTDYRHPWDKYSGEHVVMLEDFDGDMAWSVLLSLMEPYSMQLEARYANTYSNVRELYVVSNKKPSELYRKKTGAARIALYRRIELIMERHHMMPREGLACQEDLELDVQPRKLWYDEYFAKALGKGERPFTEWLKQYDPACYL